ncbi:MAG: winged helix-turn-helix transcriptional regulator [Candidatus Gastranaerophilaceae bacterium]
MKHINLCTISHVSGKYKITVFCAIYRHEVIRFNELQRYLNILSHKTLSNRIKELEKIDLIIKKDYQQIPPKVEYSLSKKGKSFIPILYDICDWG